MPRSAGIVLCQRSWPIAVSDGPSGGPCHYGWPVLIGMGRSWAVRGVDVRADEWSAGGDDEAFTAAGRACASVGWGCRWVGGVDVVSAANRRWLAGYRHSRCSGPGVVVELAEGFAEPIALMVGAEAV